MDTSHEIILIEDDDSDLEFIQETSATQAAEPQSTFHHPGNSSTLVVEETTTSNRNRSINMEDTVSVPERAKASSNPRPSTSQSTNSPVNPPPEQTSSTINSQIFECIEQIRSVKQKYKQEKDLLSEEYRASVKILNHKINKCINDGTSILHTNDKKLHKFKNMDDIPNINNPVKCEKYGNGISHIGTNNGQTNDLKSKKGDKNQKTISINIDISTNNNKRSVSDTEPSTSTENLNNKRQRTKEQQQNKIISTNRPSANVEYEVNFLNSGRRLNPPTSIPTGQSELDEFSTTQQHCHTNRLTNSNTGTTRNFRNYSQYLNSINQGPSNGSQVLNSRNIIETGPPFNVPRRAVPTRHNYNMTTDHIPHSEINPSMLERAFDIITQRILESMNQNNNVVSEAGHRAKKRS